MDLRPPIGTINRFVLVLDCDAKPPNRPIEDEDENGDEDEKGVHA